MKSAQELWSEGNQHFKNKKYQEAIRKFDEAIKLSPNTPSIWVNKGLAHQMLKQYAEAMHAFETALAINPDSTNAKPYKDKLFKLISQYSEESIIKISQSAKYSEEVYRKNVCKDEYLEKLSQLSEMHSKNKKSTFMEQIKWILYLIEFLDAYYNVNADSHPFIKSGLFSLDDFGKETRLHEIGNDLILGFKTFPTNVTDFLNQRILDIFLPTLQDDIFFEDAQKILRMIFETIYQFPREERGKLLDFLPWDKNSWYLFDFCGAIFSSNNSDKENYYGGISLTPYSFNANRQKQVQLKQYHLSVMNHSSIIKISISDILRTDISSLRRFFTHLLPCIREARIYDGQCMEDLPNLRSLLWYSKQTYNILRLLSLLPHVPGNSGKFDDTILDGSNITSNTNFDQPIDFVEFFSKQKLKADVSQAQRAFLLSLAKKIKTVSSQELANSGLLSDVSPITYGMEKPIQNSGNFRVADFVAGPITPLKRLQLTSANNYLDIDTIKGKLAFLRKLQLTGEIFIPRNWGNDLKYIDYISSDMLSAIRNGLTHIEDGGYYSVISLLEEDKERIKKLFRELQTLKEQMYETTIARQSHFLDWPESYHDISSASNAWKTFANQYWQRIKEYQQIKPIFDESTYLPNEELLDSSNLTMVLHYVKSDRSGDITKILRGESPYRIDNSDLTIEDIDDKSLKKKIKKCFKAAEDKYKILKNNARKIAQENNRLQKEKRKKDILTKMANDYPEIEKLGQAFWDAGKMPDITAVLLFEYLKNRLELLNKLFHESGIIETDKNSLQNRLSELLVKDVAFQLSISYVLGQIFSILNKLSTLTQLSHIHSSLEVWLNKSIALRNVLEHSDPILESIDLPYYQMLSDVPRMMAVVVGEVFCDYRNVILSFDPSQLPEPLKNASNRLKQEHAINPEDFVIEFSGPEIDLLIQTSRKLFKINQKLLSKPKKDTLTLNIQNLEKKDFGAGGDCLFRSIDGQIDGIGFNNLRQVTVIALKENRVNFENFIQVNTTDFLRYIDDVGDSQLELVNNFDRYLELMSRPGTWGGQIEIAILAKVLQRPICMIADEYLPMVFPSGNDESNEDTYEGEPIMLFYNGVNHYQGMISINPDISKIDIMRRLLQITIQPQVSEIATVSGSFFKPEQEHDLDNHGDLEPNMLYLRPTKRFSIWDVKSSVVCDKEQPKYQ